MHTHTLTNIHTHTRTHNHSLTHSTHSYTQHMHTHNTCTHTHTHTHNHSLTHSTHTHLFTNAHLNAHFQHVATNLLWQNVDSSLHSGTQEAAFSLCVMNTLLPDQTTRLVRIVYAGLFDQLLFPGTQFNNSDSQRHQQILVLHHPATLSCQGTHFSTMCFDPFLLPWNP